MDRAQGAAHCREHRLNDSQVLSWRKTFAENAVRAFQSPDTSREQAPIAVLAFVAAGYAIETGRRDNVPSKPPEISGRIGVRGDIPDLVVVAVRKSCARTATMIVWNRNEKVGERPNG